MNKYPSHMQALVLKNFGPANNAFKLETINTPVVSPDHMLIAVEASSVNPVDYKIRSALYQGMAPAAPTILHSDVAGIVVETGKNVKDFKVGDAVYGCAGGFIGTQGALAEYMVVDPDLMAIRPENLSAVECASLPLVAITAWQALIDRAMIRAHQTVLIHAGAGGVGSFALQLALWKKANTFTTISNEQKGAFAKSCGATLINYKTESVEQYCQHYTDGVGFDIVMDTVGGDNFTACIAACKTDGVICAITNSKVSDLAELFRKNATLHYIFMPNPIINVQATAMRKHYGNILKQVTTLVEQQHIKPLVGHTFNFSEIAEAHEFLESGLTIGKIGLKQNLGK